MPSFVVGSNDSYRVVLKTLEKRIGNIESCMIDLTTWEFWASKMFPPPHQKKNCCAENLDTGRVNEAIDVPLPKNFRKAEWGSPTVRVFATKIIPPTQKKTKMTIENQPFESMQESYCLFCLWLILLGGWATHVERLCSSNWMISLRIAVKQE